MSFLQFLRANAPFLTVGVLLTFCSSFGQTFFISIFAGNIREEFGLTNGDWGLLYSVGTTASAAVMIWTGILTDTFRVRALGPLVLGLLAGACLLMWGASGWWTLALAIFALRFTGQGMATLVASVAMARWFVATRGKALSTARVGIALGEAFLPLAFVAVMTPGNWRMLWLVAAGIVLVLIPLLYPLLKLERTPRSLAQDEQSLGMENRHWTRGQMMGHSLYWLLTPMLIAPAAFSTAFFFHQVHIAEVQGWNHLGLVATFPLFTAASVVGLFVSGAIIDRVGTARLMPLVILPMGLGFCGFALAPDLATASIFIAIMGLTVGLQNTVPDAFWAEFYGTRNLGSIRAMAAAVMVLGTAIGPALTGFFIDRGVAFPQQMIWIGIYFLAAAALSAVGIARARPSLPSQVDVERA